ncbi:MAG: S-layer homology domain-containing protein [Kastovskya adunca ATA6-11-RM4]|nr:S-layer homology domain-containing protein [Kastovskya adunca ATA6-11-RM4]
MPLLLLLPSLPVFAQPQASSEPTKLVVDASQSEAPSTPIEEVVAAKLMSPYPDGNFRPEQILSRAELATILVKAFNLEQRTPTQQTAIALQDVPPSHWAYKDIQLALKNNIMTGYREGRFFPNQRVSRAEAFSIFAQAYGVFQFPEDSVTELLSRYPDADQIPAWARKSIVTALYEDFVNIDPATNQINPLEPMTRGDMAYALSKYLERQQTTAPIVWDAVPVVPGEASNSAPN